MFNKIKKLTFFIVMTLFIIACENKNKIETDKINVLTTINYYTNLVEEIGKDKVEVISLMQEGEDPHSYVATAGDIKKIQDAELIVYAGLHLEGRMEEIFSKLANKKKLNLSEKLDKQKLIKTEENTYDPHVWFNIEFWQEQVKFVTEMLIELKPEEKEFFENNLKKYLEELEITTDYIKARIEEIPKESRYLITAHDAFGYFAQQFGMEVKAIQGISTESEIGAKEIEELANFIVKKNIKAIFVESSVNHRSIEALKEAVRSKGKEIVIGGELYSDSMGDSKSNANTYIKTLKINTDTIVDSLK
ncbi:metal ABC transporter solute-binding protein, Zn/Mn family [Fusobacterium gastrosuis]|uniref:metal ABC transporter solute-binding protein, Zn/Mn family n=1 Tax=Fusobacterium gastrosuis TaxID=1755100 RepID=UPI002AA08385|nr:zinc ABC transporter substrate-binding protein [Fusobacterium gastrosuis]